MKTIIPLAALAGLALTASTSSAAVLVYEGFDSSASGSGDAYEQDASLNGAGDARTGMTGNWSGSLAAGVVDFVSRDDNMTYSGFKTGDAGVAEFYTTRTTDQNKSLGRGLSYAAPGTDDFYIVFGWATADAIAHGVSLTAPGLPNLSMSVTSGGAVSVNFGGASADNYSGGVAHMNGDWNLLVIRAIDAPVDHSTLYYDSYELWLNPTISAGSGDVSQLGTPTATGEGSLRDNNGTVVSFSNVSLSATLQSPETIQFDEFMITKDVSDFLAVPEPTTTALLGLGGLALILRRRK